VYILWQLVKWVTIVLAVILVLALIGVLLTTRRPEHRISWVLAIMALWAIVSVAGLPPLEVRFEG